MHARKTREVFRAFTLREDHIRRLFSLLSEDLRVVRIRVTCAGGLSLDPHDIDALLAVENVIDTRIDQIAFSCKSDQGTNVSVRYSRTGSSPIEYTIEGDQESVLTLAGKLDRVISLSTERYGWLSVDRPIRWVINGLLGGCGIVGLVIAISGIHKRMQFAIVAAVAAASIFLLFEQRVFRYFYPVGQFEIGLGRSEIDRVKHRRIQYGSGAIAVVLLGLLVNFLSHAFGW